MDDLTILGLAALCWGAAIFKRRTARRRPGIRSLDALWSSLGSLGGALTLFAPPVYRGVYRVSGVPNLAELAGHGLVLVSANQARTLLLYLEGGEIQAGQVQWRRGLLAFTAAGMTVTFWLAPVDQDAPGSFTRQYASAPWVAEYWLLFLLNLCGTLLAMARQCWQLAQLSERVPLRRGLQLISAGGVLGAAYFLHWGGYLLIRRRGGELPLPARVAARTTAIAAVSSVVAGSVLPAISPALTEGRFLTALRRYTALRRLFPLWQSVCSAVPEIALDAPTDAWSDARDVHDLEHRHYRRVIEIRDGWLALRPFMSADSRERARESAARAGIVGDQLQATVEAAELAAAIQRKRAGACAESKVASLVPPESRDLAEESAWLEQVSREFRSPIVRQLATDADPKIVSKP